MVNCDNRMCRIIASPKPTGIAGHLNVTAQKQMEVEGGRDRERRKEGRERQRLTHSVLSNFLL